ncbi:PadR family transcriptional regulator [Microbacterium sp. YY-01]|uniref:PadR family transcriptional regulator n=1 Tax=Microbacterium sp. YY-01 TaxID=3421634 RepID=UPI003D180A8E
MLLEDRALINLRKGVSEYCVLAMLRQSPAYGLELARRLESDGLIASSSTLYPLLSRLSAAGFVDSEWGESDRGRPRKYYVLTSTGERALEAFQSIWIPLRDAVDRTVKGGP